MQYILTQAELDKLTNEANKDEQVVYKAVLDSTKANIMIDPSFGRDEIVTVAMAMSDLPERVQQHLRDVSYNAKY